MNIIGYFVYFYTRKAHYTGALILMGDLQLCKKSCRNRAWLGENRCVFVAGKRRNWLSIEVKGVGGSANLTTKTIFPSTSSQTVYASSNGYDGFSSVTVNAISPTKSAQTYTPTTYNQTISSGQWLSGT